MNEVNSLKQCVWMVCIHGQDTKHILLNQLLLISQTLCQPAHALKNIHSRENRNYVCGGRGSCWPKQSPVSYHEQIQFHEYSTCATSTNFVTLCALPPFLLFGATISEIYHPTRTFQTCTFHILK